MTFSKILNAIIIGPPGGGKGTISKKLVKDFAFIHISTGDLLRECVQSGSDLGKHLQLTLAKGELVSDEVVTSLLAEASKKPVSHLLDGFPRTIKQAQMLTKLIQVDCVLSLNVPHDVILNRIANRWIHASSGRTYSYDYNPPKVLGFDDITGESLTKRPDDNVEIFRARLDTFQSMTAPVLEYYKSQHKLVEFVGEESDVIYPSVYEYIRSRFV